MVLAVAPPAWTFTRHIVTLVHEAGHALVALLTGRRLTSIRLHSDTSGLTVSSGRPRGVGMVATAMAGYLAPAGLGVAVVALVEAGLTAWGLWASLAVLALMLVHIRNWFGLLTVALAGLAVAVLIWRAAPDLQDLAALAFAWLLLVGAPRTCLELWSHRRHRRTRTSDADVLARLTHVPATIWNAVFVLATGVALAGAVVMVG